MAALPLHDLNPRYDLSIANLIGNVHQPWKRLNSARSYRGGSNKTHRSFATMLADGGRLVDTPAIELPASESHFKEALTPIVTFRKDLLSVKPEIRADSKNTRTRVCATMSFTWIASAERWSDMRHGVLPC